MAMLLIFKIIFTPILVVAIISPFVVIYYAIKEIKDYSMAFKDTQDYKIVCDECVRTPGGIIKVDVHSCCIACGQKVG